MPTFHYQAVDARGRNINGKMTAADENNLEEKLKSLEIWLIHARREDARSKTDRKPSNWRGGINTVPRRELIDFCALMKFQTQVGIPLMQALDVSSQNCQDARFKFVLTSMQRDIEGGLLFHEALERYPEAFSNHFTSVIRAGETSSKLPESFESLRKYLEWVDQVVADVRQATLYPLIVILVMGGFCLYLFTFIVPKFMALLVSVHVQTPLLTQVVFGISDFVRMTWWVWLLALAFLAIGIPIGKKVSKRFAYYVDLAKINVPIFGELNLMLAFSRFTHNLSILYGSGIPVVQSLNLCLGLIDNAQVEEAVVGVAEEVKSGSSIGAAMQKQKIFPPIVLRMVTMGETSGKLDEALQNVSDYYNDIIPRRIKKVFTVMEPVLTVTLIFMIGAVALAIYLPIISLMGGIGKQ